jgi:hypothetical protein
MNRVGRLCFVLFLWGLSVSASGQVVVNNFDSGLQSWRFDFGAAGSTLSNDPTMDSTGNPNSGSLKMDMPFNASLGGDNKFAYTGDLFFPGQNFAAIYSSLQFDLKVEPGSALDAFGNHGFFAFVSRETDNYNYNQVLGVNLNPADDGNWVTYTVPTASFLQTRAFTTQLYGGPSQNITGRVVVWMDNIRFVPEPTGGICSMIGLLLLGFRRR